MVAVKPDTTQAAQECSNCAWIGEVLKNAENGFVKVGWYAGSLNGSWRKLSRPRSDKNTDNIPLSSIFLWGFKLLKSGHLEKAARDEIHAEMLESSAADDANELNESLNSSEGEF